MQLVVAAGAGGAAAFGLVLALAMVPTVSASPTPGALTPAGAASPCVTSGPLPSLDPAQAANARTVVAVAAQQGGEQAAVIAVMTAITESGLRVLGNLGVVGAISTQGSGTNYDSVGLFQQRAGWGTVAQRLDPVESTTLFTDRLLALPGWQTMNPWLAAQAVQVSAFTGVPSVSNGFSPVVGANYLANLPEAEAVVTQVSGQASTLACGALAAGTGPVSAPGLPIDYVIPASATPPEARAVSFALGQLGKPYLWGAAGPGAFDCSGLTMAAWATAGIPLPHNSVAQFSEGTPVGSPALMSPGDLVFTPGTDGTLAAPGHVGMYVGDGLVINAADTRLGLIVQTYANFVRSSGGLSGIRHLR